MRLTKTLGNFDFLLFGLTVFFLLFIIILYLPYRSPVDIVAVVDRSGSMSGSKMRLVRVGPTRIWMVPNLRSLAQDEPLITLICLS